MALLQQSHQQPRLVVILEPPGRFLPALMAQLALRGGLWVLDAGNRFQAYAIARHLRRLTPDLDAVLGRIQVARAFTCYQVLAALEPLPHQPGVFLVLDLLSTFYDQSVPLRERERLLTRCMHLLERLARQALAGVTVYFQPGRPETPFLLQVVERAAHELWRFPLQSRPPPPRLF